VVAATALHLGIELVDGLEVDRRRMWANVEAQGGYTQSEPVMRALADRLGKHRAHALVYAASIRGLAEGRPLGEALAADPDVALVLTPADLERLLDPVAAARPAIALVDRVVAAASEPVGA
jgi:adenylosuccinate lyase